MMAEDGIGLPEEVLDESAKFDRAAMFYFFFIRWDFIWSLNIFALVLLNFLEVPYSFACECINASFGKCKRKKTKIKPWLDEFYTLKSLLTLMKLGPILA
ncbi:Two pore calcium channel protein 1 [Acorus calamus]|uniref:Two pore calcium channel protein 1 n=1 Tax=Acorus calamus TaxID=4465 RepID=A0AAV9EGM9_ACOCL|nr:Two pore calcium channel protein 1 [Acorus calamus]